MEKTLESLLNFKEIKPVNPKKISPEYSLEEQMLKLQYLGQLMPRADSMEKTGYWERLRAKGTGVAEDEMVGWHH